MQAHQLAHVVDLVVAEAPAGQYRRGHLGADLRVVVEGMAAVRGDNVGWGLGDVVKQRGGSRHQVGRCEIDGRDGMPVHVVGVVAPLLDADPRDQLGQDELEQPSLKKHGDPGTRVGRDQHAADLIADPFDGEDRGSRRLRSHCLDGPRREREAEPGDKSSCPVHAQRVLGKGLGRIQRRAKHPGDQVGDPLTGDVDHLPLERLAQRVDREIPAPYVLGERARPDVGVTRFGVVAFRPGPDPFDDPGPAADLGGAEALEALRGVPPESGCDRGEQRHRVHAHRDEVDVLALGSAEQAVPDEPADEVDLRVECPRRRRDGFEDVLELWWVRGDLADGGGHGIEGTGRSGRPRSRRAARIAAMPAQIDAPRKTARSSVTIAEVTSRS